MAITEGNLRDSHKKKVGAIKPVAFGCVIKEKSS